MGTSKKNGRGVVDYGESSAFDVFGKGGSTRHSGSFHPNENPYFDDMQMGSNNKDIDAAYERAVEWEADYANLQEQRAYNEAMRDEQRAYDSPLADLMRKRAAGYNPDIAEGGAGAGAGSSSAGVPPMQIADQQAQSKFKNAYDDTAQVFQGIQTASSLIGSLSSGYSSIISGISQLKITPSQVALNEANAQLSSSQANEINALLEGKKKALDLDNTARYVEQIGSLQGLLKNGFSDEEGTNLFNTLGIPVDQQGQLMQSIRGIHQNPALLAKFHNDTLNARHAKWNNKVFDDDTVESFTQLAKQIEFDRLQFDCADAYLQQSVMNALMYDLDYQDNLVQTALNNASTDKVNSDIAYQNALADCDAWGNLWDEKKAVCDGLKTEVDKLKAKAEEDGQWTEEEIGNYTVAWSKYQACRGSLSNEFNSMRGFFIDAMQKRYERNKILKNNGETRSADVIGAINYFSKLNFDSAYDSLPSGAKIAREWFGVSGGFVRDLGIGVGSVLNKSKK